MDKLLQLIQHSQLHYFSGLLPLFKRSLLHTNITERTLSSVNICLPIVSCYTYNRFQANRSTFLRANQPEEICNSHHNLASYRVYHLIYHSSPTRNTSSFLDILLVNATHRFPGVADFFTPNLFFSTTPHTRLDKAIQPKSQYHKEGEVLSAHLIQSKSERQLL